MVTFNKFESLQHETKQVEEEYGLSQYQRDRNLNRGK